MTGKPHERPRPDWNILKRLSQLAALPTHESDNHSIRTLQPLSDSERFEPQGAQNDKAGPDGGPAEKNARNRPLGIVGGIGGGGV